MKTSKKYIFMGVGLSFIIALLLSALMKDKLSQIGQKGKEKISDLSQQGKETISNIG